MAAWTTPKAAEVGRQAGKAIKLEEKGFWESGATGSPVSVLLSYLSSLNLWYHIFYSFEMQVLIGWNFLAKL